MGSFFGHIDEGVVFITLAVWWMYNMFRDYNQSLQKNGEPFQTRLSYVSVIRKRQVPLEIILKIAFTSLALLAEIFGNGIPVSFVDENNRFTRLHHVQHMTIYGLFVIHGVTDLLDYLKVSPLMKEMKYITVMMSFFWYASQFFYHSANSVHKSPLENMIHRVPLTTMITIVLMCLWEMKQRETIVPMILRCLGVLTLGTWFSHVSFILYLPSPFPGQLPNPTWDQYDEENVHFITALYGFHFIFNLLFMLLFYALMTSYRKMVVGVKRILGRENNSMATYEYHTLNESDS